MTRHDPSVEDDALPIDPDLLDAAGATTAQHAAAPAAEAQQGAPHEPAERDSLLRRLGDGGRDILATIALGGALGAVARYAIEKALPTRPGSFPWSTFLINVSGSFALALLIVFVLELWPPTRFIRPFVGIGFLGGYTTFSTAIVEVDQLLARHDLATGTIYAFGSLFVGFAAVAFGLQIGRAIVSAAASRGQHQDRGGSP